MTKSAKQKYVVSETFTSENRVPEEGENIVRLVCAKGSNLFEVEGVGDVGEKFLVSMPSRFRKTLWVKRGDHLVIHPIDEGDKVKGEIVEILTNARIKFLKKQGIWPVEDQEDDTCDVDIPQNTNRSGAPIESDSSDSSDHDC